MTKNNKLIFTFEYVSAYTITNINISSKIETGDNKWKR
jgi:hypothetical protein